MFGKCTVISGIPRHICKNADVFDPNALLSTAGNDKEVSAEQFLNALLKAAEYGIFLKLERLTLESTEHPLNIFAQLPFTSSSEDKSAETKAV
ncbi:MAG: hypothetical protein II453_04110, partial [Alphaproteobacteria bacterium]|nr:hypothetical protein [Alphaproteobacteria bacterium]